MRQPIACRLHMARGLARDAFRSDVPEAAYHALRMKLLPESPIVLRSWPHFSTFKTCQRMGALTVVRSSALVEDRAGPVCRTVESYLGLES
jgi:hypothetical protein